MEIQHPMVNVAGVEYGNYEDFAFTHYGQSDVLDTGGAHPGRGRERSVFRQAGENPAGLLEYILHFALIGIIALPRLVCLGVP